MYITCQLKIVDLGVNLMNKACTYSVNRYEWSFCCCGFKKNFTFYSLLYLFFIVFFNNYVSLRVLGNKYSKDNLFEIHRCIGLHL